VELGLAYRRCGAGALYPVGALIAEDIDDDPQFAPRNVTPGESRAVAWQPISSPARSTPYLERR